MTLVFPSVSPRLGNNYTTIAFAVIVLGGLRNPTGALFGGVLFSLAENVSGVFLPASLSSAVAFIILIVTISIRPEGILSSVKIKRSSLPQSPPGTEKAAGR